MVAFILIWARDASKTVAVECGDHDPGDAGRYEAAREHEENPGSPRSLPGSIRGDHLRGTIGSIVRRRADIVLLDHMNAVILVSFVHGLAPSCGARRRLNGQTSQLGIGSMTATNVMASSAPGLRPTVMDETGDICRPHRHGRAPRRPIASNSRSLSSGRTGGQRQCDSSLTIP